MSDYKVGDRVKNISSGYRQEFGPEEDSRVVHGVVKDVAPNGVDVLWDNCEKAYYCFREEIELLEETAPLVEPVDVLYDESGSGSGVSCGPSFSDLVKDFQLKFPIEGDTPEVTKNGFNGIVSTGGCTSYYDFLPEWVTLNDMMDYKAQNQWGPLSFHMGNITKATYRFGEKDGTSQVYDLNKIIYSGLRAKLMLEDKQSVRDYLNELLNDPQFM